MCGRFVSTSPPSVIAERFAVDDVALDEEVPARWNVAPTDRVFAVRSSSDGSSRRLDLLRWGLVPSWADSPAIGSRFINARAETIATKAAFRSALARRRCVIPADGFYEWRALEAKSSGRVTRRPWRRPYFVHAADEGMLAFAGLWEGWKDAEGQWMRTCTIVTTAANDLMAPIHDRMPVILPDGAWEQWLSPGLDGDAARDLLVPAAPGVLEVHAVSDRVNSVRNEGADLIEPETDG